MPCTLILDLFLMSLAPDSRLVSCFQPCFQAKTLYVVAFMQL